MHLAKPKRKPPRMELAVAAYCRLHTAVAAIACHTASNARIHVGDRFLPVFIVSSSKAV